MRSSNTFYDHLNDHEVLSWCALDTQTQALIIQKGLSNLTTSLTLTPPLPVDNTSEPQISPGLKGATRVNKVLDMLTKPSFNCSFKPHSTDIKLISQGKTLYIEVKNYNSSVPKRELTKFFNDIETKSDINGAILVGWNETKFMYYQSIPVLLIQNELLINECVELLLGIPPKKNIDKIIESANSVVNLLNTLNDMEDSFNKHKNQLRDTLVVFRERCSNFKVESTQSLSEIKALLNQTHASKDPYYSFLLSILPNQVQVSGKTLSFNLSNKDIKVILYKTKTVMSIPGLDNSYTMTFELTPSSITHIRTLLGLPTH